MWMETIATFCLHVGPIALMLGLQVRAERRALRALARSNELRRKGAL